MLWILGMMVALAGGPKIEIVTDGVTIAPEMDYAMRSVMKEIYRAYSETLGLRVAEPPTVVIHVTADESAMRKAFGGNQENVGGFYSHKTKEAWVLVVPHDPHPEHGLFHEVSHGLLHAATGRAIPPWLNEGLAEVFSQGYVMGRRLAARPDAANNAAMMQASRDGELPTLRSIVGRSAKDWWALRAKDVRMAYASSWAATAFLLSSDEGRSRVKQILGAAGRGRDPAASIEILAGWPGGWHALETRWRQWVDSPKQDVLLASAPESKAQSDGPNFVRCADASFVLEGTPCPH